MFCMRCGVAIPENAIFCPSCGRPTQVTGSQFESYPPNEYLSHRERFSGIVWVVIAVLQLLFGINGHLGLLILGVLNLFAVNDLLRQAEKVKTPYDTLVSEYDSRRGGIILMMILNLFIGGVIGFFAGWYDLSTRKYVVNNADLFQKTYQDYRNKH